jgi:hypothetical protein
MSYPPPPSGQSPYPSASAPGPGYGGPPTTLRGRTPRRLGWIFLALAVIAFVIGGIIVGTKSLGKVNDFQRVSFASGTGKVTVDGTGKWVGYYEASNVDTSINRIPQFQAAMTSPSGATVQLKPYGNRSDGKVDKFTYDYNGHKGAAAFEFTADQKGTYTIQLEAVDTLPSGADVAIGRDITGGAIAGGLVIVLGVLLLVTAIILLIVGFVKRSHHKKEIASGNYGFGSPQPYGYPQQPPSGYPQQSTPGFGQQPPPPQGYPQQPGGWQPPEQQEPPRSWEPPKS